MAKILNTISVAANSAIPNLLASLGSAYQYMPDNANVSIAIRQQTGNIGDVLATVRSGTDVLKEEGPLKVATGFPDPANDAYLRDAILQGELFLVAFRNTTAGAIVVSFDIDIDIA